MLLEYEPSLVQAGVLISPTQPLGTGNAFNTGDAPEFSQKFYTTVVVKSTRDHIVLPHNANLGSFSKCLLIIMKIFLKQLIILLTH